MEIVAHRAGNTVADAEATLGRVDMIELDVHVFRGRVEVRHAKLLRPTARLWERWYLLPRGTTGVPIGDVLAVLPPTTPLMIDMKCFTRHAGRRMMAALPPEAPVVASTRSWWALAPFRNRDNTRVLHSCGSRWQLWWALHITRFHADHGVCVHEQRLTPEVLSRLRQRTPLIFTWGVRTTARCRELEESGLTGVILDDYGII